MKKLTIIHTEILNNYFFKFAIRILVFTAVFVMYLFKKDLLLQLMTMDLAYGINFLHVLWFAFMVMMLRHLSFPKKFTMALRKAKDTEYIEVKGYSRLELYEYVHDQNIKAWKVMLVWLSGNAVLGILYLLQVLDDVDLLMVTVFYFLCDYICILIFCPFQTGIMKNKCCVNCRIYDWGHFMMFTPMLFIKNFFSWSLFFTSVVVLIHWELIYASYPERFWSGSNQKLRCAACQDKICQVKRRIGNN